MVLVASSTASLADRAISDLQVRHRMQGAIWHGPDDTLDWDLHRLVPNTTGGGALLMPSVQGLIRRKPDRYVSAQPRHGQRFRGFRAPAREVFLPVLLWAAKGKNWQDVADAFLATLNPDPAFPGMLEWVDTAGRRRFLTMQWSDTSGEPDSDPTRKGVGRFGFVFVADQPFWEGPPISESFSNAPAQDWLPQPNRPDIFISSSTDMTTATATNPGDVDAYPIYRADGPLGDVRVGLNGRLIHLPWVLNEGQYVIFDTRIDSPTGFGVWDNTGANRTNGLPAYTPEAIPAGKTVPVSLEASGTGKITVTVVPRYWDAY